MSILKYLGHPYLGRTEQLCVLIHFARMIDVDDLSDVLGLSQTNITSLIHLANRKGKYFTGKRVGGLKGRKMYFLAPLGCKVVSDILGKKVSYYEFSEYRGKHYKGINQILFRLIKAVGLDRAKEYIDWKNTSETSSYLKQVYFEVVTEELRKDESYYKETVKNLVHPDALLTINGVEFFVEYDNNTEDPPQLKQKMRDLRDMINDMIYIRPGQKKPLVLWVAPTAKRTKELKELWQSIRQDGIDMGFYEAGTETAILSALIPSKSQKNIS